MYITDFLEAVQEKFSLDSLRVANVFIEINFACWPGRGVRISFLSQKSILLESLI